LFCNAKLVFVIITSNRKNLCTDL